MAQQRLTKELVDTAIANYRDEMESSTKQFLKGYLTNDDVFRLTERANYDFFWSTFKKKHIELQLNASNFKAFEEEYRSFLSGNSMEKANHTAWLFDTERMPVEASENDQKLFFSLMERFDLSPSFFEPYPDDVLTPNKTYCHTYHAYSSVRIPFHCIDDRGLLCDDNPVDKSFVLVNDLGLKAKVTILEDRRVGDRTGMDFDEIVFSTKNGIVTLKAEFLAAGSIEGYTAEEKRGDPEMLIRLNNKGEIAWLAYWENADDLHAHYNHPIWREYFDLAYTHRMVWVHYFESQIEKFKNTQANV